MAGCSSRGVHGDKVWGESLYDDSANIVRGDPTGLALTEFCLWAGFIHCPVPFMAARYVGAINALSNAEEQQFWDVPSDYSWPLCRRIVETAGIPREMFGIEKKAASVIMQKRNDSFLTGESLVSCRLWLAGGRLPIQWTLTLYGCSPVWSITPSGGATKCRVCGALRSTSGG